MKKAICFAVTSLAAILPGGAADAESYGITLTATIPVTCTINHVAGGGQTNDQAVALGALREFCNAPRGYDLVMSYTPGSLRGARIIAGSAEIVLDGSGRSTVSHSTMPRIRETPISAVPGQNGFDTDRVEFALVPNG